MQAATRCSRDIVIAMKNMPHDYYPTFPNNPRIGNTGDRPQWVEFDCWGQFYGMGFFPCSVVEDMHRRFEFCHAHGVQGIWLRTDWEGMIEASTFNSFNILNVIAGGLLSNNIQEDMDIIYKK